MESHKKLLDAYRMIWCSLTMKEQESILNVLDHTVDLDVRSLIYSDRENIKEIENKMH